MQRNDSRMWNNNLVVEGGSVEDSRYHQSAPRGRGAMDSRLDHSQRSTGSRRSKTKESGTLTESMMESSAYQAPHHTKTVSGHFIQRRCLVDQVWTGQSFLGCDIGLCKNWTFFCQSFRFKHVIFLSISLSVYQGWRWFNQID